MKRTRNAILVALGAPSFEPDAVVLAAAAAVVVVVAGRRIASYLMYR
jgi:hypothetical protein